jgi:hypothetical protein
MRHEPSDFCLAIQQTPTDAALPVEHPWEGPRPRPASVPTRPTHRPWEQWRDAQERAATNPVARVGGSAPIIRVSSQSSTGGEGTWRTKQAPPVRARPASQTSCSR